MSGASINTMRISDARWRTTGTAQTILLGLIFFCVPGMWNSITSMAGGIDDPTISSAATATLYTCYAISSTLASGDSFGTKYVSARAVLM